MVYRGENAVALRRGGISLADNTGSVSPTELYNKSLSHLRHSARACVEDFLTDHPMSRFLQGGCDVKVYVGGGHEWDGACVVFVSRATGIETDVIVTPRGISFGTTEFQKERKEPFQWREWEP